MNFWQLFNFFYYYKVGKKKICPHLFFARLWRWPELLKNELESLDICNYPFDQEDASTVCVNPYHCKRVISIKAWKREMHNLICDQTSSSDEQFAKDAINWLQGRLKDKPGEMLALWTSVDTKGRLPIVHQCTTISLPNDGRIQVFLYMRYAS